MRKSFAFATRITLISLLGIPAAWAQNYNDKEKAELAEARNGAKVSLEKGLLASEREGMPISGGFEVVGGELELWVSVVKGDKFFEITVDHETEEVDEVEMITSHEDLTDAKTQSQAMAKATSLRAATERAIKGNRGFRAVNGTPALKDGRPVADITLLRGQEFKVIMEKLDYEEPGGLKENKDSAAIEESEWDPWEPFNEKVFWFNRQFDSLLLKPVAAAYDTVLPSAVKKGIINAFDNLDVVRRLVNNILQLKIDGAGTELARFVINSSIGIGGFFDVADNWFDIEESNKDTGQTLGVYGIGPGPYLILPFFPSLTVRDFFGFLADEAMYPLDYFIPLGAVLGLYATEKVSDRANNLDKFEGVEEAAIDLYGAVRGAYFQRRAAAIKGDLGE